jgi:hypothetical protein
MERTGIQRLPWKSQHLLHDGRRISTLTPTPSPLQGEGKSLQFQTFFRALDTLTARLTVLPTGAGALQDFYRFC